MATEKLKFKIELFATYWNLKPICDISLNDKTFWTGSIMGSEAKPDVIEFEADLHEGQDYKLIINRQGKDKKQTILDGEKIIKDQLLHIKTIEIDEINIGALVYEGIYRPEYPEPWASQQIKAGVNLPETLKNVTNMGHNGTWTLNFNSPFYMWLLENLY